MLKHEKIKKEFEKMCEKEFQGIYFIKEYYKKLSEKVWLTGLKIHDKVAVFESYERGHCFRYVTVVRISKGWFTIIDEYDCKSKYDRKTGKQIVKYPADEGDFMCRPQDWMNRINKELQERIKLELDEEYEKHKDNEAWLKHAHWN